MADLSLTIILEVSPKGLLCATVSCWLLIEHYSDPGAAELSMGWSPWRSLVPAFEVGFGFLDTHLLIRNPFVS